MLIDNYPEEVAENLATLRTVGKWTHDYSINFEMAQELGLRFMDIKTFSRSESMLKLREQLIAAEENTVIVVVRMKIRISGIAKSVGYV